MSHTKGTGSIRVLTVIAKSVLPFISFYGESLSLAGMAFIGRDQGCQAWLPRTASNFDCCIIMKSSTYEKNPKPSIHQKRDFQTISVIMLVIVGLL